jgi:hypothetical protein
MEKYESFLLFLHVFRARQARPYKHDDKKLLLRSVEGEQKDNISNISLQFMFMPFFALF